MPSIGVPIPDNVGALPLEELYKLHAAIWAERAQLKAKMSILKPYLDVLTAQKNQASRAGFDMLLNLGGGQEMTRDDAKSMVARAAAGTLKLPGTVLKALSDFANGGGN
jgi:hypothetical protein